VDVKTREMSSPDRRFLLALFGSRRAIVFTLHGSPRNETTWRKIERDRRVSGFVGMGINSKFGFPNTSTDGFSRRLACKTRSYQCS